MSTNDDFYQKFSSDSPKSGGFKSNVIVPFISGILGAILVIGVCFGVPNIRNKIEKINNNNIQKSNNNKINKKSKDKNIKNLKRPKKQPVINIQILSQQNTEEEKDWLSEEPEKKSVSVPKNNMLPFFIIFFI